MTSLNGEPEPNIALEAQGLESCGKVLEESVSDQDGKFRIRGLQVCYYKTKKKIDRFSHNALQEVTTPIRIKFTFLFLCTEDIVFIPRKHSA